MQDAAAQALGMAGLSLADIGHSEGYGFVPPGEGLARIRAGVIAIGGRLPVNTDGGSMSGSYMHGWNMVVECVRQLRHDAGPRQAAGVQASMFSLTQTDQTDPILFTRGA